MKKQIKNFLGTKRILTRDEMKKIKGGLDSGATCSSDCGDGCMGDDGCLCHNNECFDMKNPDSNPGPLDMLRAVTVQNLSFTATEKFILNITNSRHY